MRRRLGNPIRTATNSGILYPHALQWDGLPRKTERFLHKLKTIRAWVVCRALTYYLIETVIETVKVENK